MMRECVVLNGKVINIGAWDYQTMDGIVNNPLPEGVEIVELEISQDADGGWGNQNDYTRLRQAAYPSFSPFDILDEILKQITPASGSKLEEIQNARLAVKAQYPKP